MFKSKKWKVTLSKDGSNFDEAKLNSLQECIRWAEELRFEDHYLVTIYEPNSKNITMQYIYDRNIKDIDLTQNLFCKFK